MNRRRRIEHRIRDADGEGVPVRLHDVMVEAVRCKDQDAVALGLGLELDTVDRRTGALRVGRRGRRQTRDPRQDRPADEAGQRTPLRFYRSDQGRGTG